MGLTVMAAAEPVHVSSCASIITVHDSASVYSALLTNEFSPTVYPASGCAPPTLVSLLPGVFLVCVLGRPTLVYLTEGLPLIWESSQCLKRHIPYLCPCIRLAGSSKVVCHTEGFPLFWTSSWNLWQSVPRPL